MDNKSNGKSRLNKLRSPLISLALLFGAALPASALSLSVNPPVITNNYHGSVTLTISGLSAPGVGVRIERIIDVNSNGIIDSGEIATESFIVMDGQLPLIGGVRNQNVPGDDDATVNSAIQCKIPYPSANQTLDHIAAQYLFRVTDTNNGATATNSLLIKQAILPQGVTGTLVATGGAPITNAPVVLSSQNGNGYGTISDINGNYTIYAPPGSYAVLGVARGIIANQNIGVTVASNVISTVNVTNQLTDGTTISGTVVDSSSLAGLPGIFMQAQTKTGLFASAFTGFDGSYVLEVIPESNWSLKLEGGAGSSLGYCRNSSIQFTEDTTSGNVMNVTFPMLKGDSLIHGIVTDPHTNPVEALQMDGNDINDTYDAKGLTASDGSYCVALPDGDDLIQPDSAAAGALGFISPPQASINLSSNQAGLQNFQLLAITATLSGFVYDNTGAPVGNVNMTASPVPATNSNFNLNFQTGSDGSYSVGVYGGEWNLALECDNAASLGLVSPNLDINVTDGVNQSDIDLIAYQSSPTISGFVTNSSGSPISGLNISVSTTLNGTNYFVGCESTSGSGGYSFGVFAGTWTISFDQGELNGLGLGATNPVVTVNGNSSVVVDIGLFPPPVLLTQMQMAPGEFGFEVQGLGGTNYRVEASTTLLSNSWVPLGTNMGTFFFWDTNAGQFTNRFYRTFVLP